MIKRVCAWCEIVMEYPGEDSDQVTHGICPRCYDKLMAKLGAAAREQRHKDGSPAEINSLAPSCLP